MTNDIRHLKSRIGEAQKRHAAEQEKRKNETKAKLHGAAEKKIQKIKEKKNVNIKRGAAFEKTIHYLKISATALLLISSAFFLSRAFKEKPIYANVTLSLSEEDADELEQKSAKRFVRTILSEIERNGISAIGNLWNPNACEEARVQAEELLFGASSSSFEISAVKKISPVQFKVICLRNSQLVSFRIVKMAEGIRLLSVE